MLQEDELSGMGIVIKYSYHNTVLRIHLIIPDQSTTSSKKLEGWFDLVRNEKKKLSSCFVFLVNEKNSYVFLSPYKMFF